MSNILSMTVTFVLLVGLGAGAGYFAARTSGGKAAAVDDAGGPPQFTPQTLKNLGVEVGKAQLGSFVSHREIQAVVQDAPLNVRPVAVPLAGIVQSIAVQPGTIVKGGGALVTVVRDAIPRPELKLTGEMFAPVSESLHAAFSELRSASIQLDIAGKELARVRKINAATKPGEAPLVPKKTEIDLGYQRDSALQRTKNARSELEHHGLSTKEVDAVAAGEHPPRGRDLWKRVLSVHGLWSAPVAKLFEALPRSTRDLPWSIAILGELAAAGIVSDELVESTRKSAAIRNHFVDVAGLLLQGQTVTRVRWLAERGAIDSTFALRAPEEGSLDWDVVEVKVRPGQHVGAGEIVAVLHDAREMWLRLEPVGDETTLVMDALRNSQQLTATPLLTATGPAMRGLKILRLATRGERGSDVAFVRCTNERLDGPASGARTWQLREGMRYVVRLPSANFDKVFVLAKDAVAKEGANRVVFLQNGDSFVAKPVHVVFEDEDNIVVANDGALFPSDEIVTRGAFVLGIAMQQSAGGAHHGHTH